MSIQLDKIFFSRVIRMGHSLLLPGFLFLALGFAFEMMNDGRHLGVDASDLSFVSYKVFIDDDVKDRLSSLQHYKCM